MVILMSDRYFTVECCVISFLLSLLASAIAYKAKDMTTIKREKYFNFYYPFYTLWDSIHQARAFNFSDLDKEDQDKIMGFLIEHSPYADAKLDEQIYILKSSRHENFYNMDNGSIQEANKAYNQIIDIMIDRENSLRKKYIAKK